MNSMLKYAEIEGIIKDLNSCKANAENTLNQIKATYNSTIPDVWSGTAANTTKDEFDSLAANFVKLTEAIDSEISYLNETLRRYREADSKVQAAMQGRA